MSAFKCEPDFCDTLCVPSAFCTRTLSTYGGNRHEARYECSCQEGWIGTGRACSGGGSPPTVFIDDATRDIRTDGEMPCGCQVGMPDPCSGVSCGDNALCIRRADGTADCACAPGFTLRNETSTTRATKMTAPASVTCVDETLPELNLHGEASIEITQCGEPYEELGVQIIDDIAATYERSLRIAYSNARDFPSRRAGYRHGKTPFFRRGDYRVSYRVDTPWRTPNYVEATRIVSVVDEDECSLPTNHPCAPRCALYATCANEVGGYRCICPAGAAGDGFLGPNETKGPPSYWQLGHGADNQDAWRVPRTFAGGTGCTDVEKPNLLLLGPNPVSLRVERCQTLAARYSSTSARRGNLSSLGLGRDPDAELIALVSEAPETLCETADPSQCAAAYDTNPLTGEQVDLSSRVAVGRPFRVDRKSHHPRNSVVYSVPYTVSDDAGNEATDHREIVLQFMTLDDMEGEVRRDSTTSTGTCEKPAETHCPKCDTTQPSATFAKAFCKEGIEDAERRRAKAETEAVALRRTVSQLQSENADLKRRSMVWLCSFLITLVVAFMSLYSAGEVPPAAKLRLRKEQTQNGHRQAAQAPASATQQRTQSVTSSSATGFGNDYYHTPSVSDPHPSSPDETRRRSSAGHRDNRRFLRRAHVDDNARRSTTTHEGCHRSASVITPDASAAPGRSRLPKPTKAPLLRGDVCPCGPHREPGGGPHSRRQGRLAPQLIATR